MFSWFDQTLAFVRARAQANGQFHVTRHGVERQGDASLSDFARRLEALGLKGCQTRVMLRPQQYQCLQIEAPVVEPEELRSAARYQIRDMIDTHIDDVTIDVMRVGDGLSKGTAHLFVVAAPNAALRAATELGNAMHWSIPVIDVQETAQRNLQNALAQRAERAERANAALVLVDESKAVLTICANEELFYTRRLDVPQGFLAESWSTLDSAAAPLSDAFTPVGEYVPEYGVGGVSYGSDYSAPGGRAEAGGVTSSAEGESAQRFLVEVQRSLDLWDRAWSSMPLASVSVFAGARSAELAQWLTRELGQSVVPMDASSYFPGFAGGAESDLATCWPLLGMFMRTESRKL